ncbi:jg23658, partial [Pararge aegeria aegeria]
KINNSWVVIKESIALSLGLPEPEYQYQNTITTIPVPEYKYQNTSSRIFLFIKRSLCWLARHF